MRSRGFGRIINISSINGRKGQDGPDQHSAAKAGLLGFTKAVAQESARARIHLNVIAPGYIGTEMVIGGAQGDPRGRRSCRSDPMRAPRHGRRRSPAASPSSPPTMPASSPARLDANGGQYMA
jgi:acetoacetyl-CoA reductase